MNQTITKQDRACLELSLVSSSAGQAARWCRLFQCTAQELLQRICRLAADQWLPDIKREHQIQLKKAAAEWNRGILSEQAGRVLQCCQEQAIEWLTWEDPAYPPLLKEIDCPPVVLYGRGKLEILQDICISVVGSRKATAYGQKAAYEIAREASEAGFAIVSGLAKGIDASAHKGALDCGGRTVAVMPCGLDLCYPQSHLWLYRRICSEGAAVSEYPPGQKAEKWHFIDRNRLVSGISIATVVAQAGPKSGSIRTAQLAAEQGREVFGVPGDIFDSEYLGVHNLLQDGANVLTSPRSMIRMLAQGRLPEMLSEKKLGHAVDFAPRRAVREMDEGVQRSLEMERRLKRKQAGKWLWLYDAINEFGSTVEELCRQTGKSAQELQQAITGLEVSGLVQKSEKQQIIKI